MILLGVGAADGGPVGGGAAMVNSRKEELRTREIRRKILIS